MYFNLCRKACILAEAPEKGVPSRSPRKDAENEQIAEMKANRQNSHSPRIEYSNWVRSKSRFGLSSVAYAVVNGLNVNLIYVLEFLPEDECQDG